MYRLATVLLLVVFFFSGCGELPNIPTIDDVQVVPDSSQATILPQEQFSPKEGPVGTLVTIYGRGTVFPAGIVHFSFSGTGSVEFDLAEATSELQVKIPYGTASGPFGFTISGRTSIAIENSLPTSNVFKAWRFEAPGFSVVAP